MLSQVFTDFHLELFPQLIVGYWQVFAFMALGFILHYAPERWECFAGNAIIRLPLVGKALFMIALIYWVIQIKSADIQPFIYFQF